MGSAFNTYLRELSQQDLAPATIQKYSQILRDYRAWLSGKEPSEQTALAFLAKLRSRGYESSSTDLYGLVLKGFHTALEQKLLVKRRHRLAELGEELLDQRLHLLCPTQDRSVGRDNDGVLGIVLKDAVQVSSSEGLVRVVYDLLSGPGQVFRTP